MTDKSLRTRTATPRASMHHEIGEPVPNIPIHRRFNYVNGSKLHAYHRDDAPWPFRFNRETIEQGNMDHALIARIKGSQVFTDFSGRPFPTRVLDLGCGLGDWVIDTAQRNPGTTFVGFDLVDVQIPLRFAETDVAKRIEWRYGNFLRFPLPFPDNEFDFIHLEGVALGVPEHKWDPLFEELNRILKPEGTIEILQQDAIFPVLPRWFTGPLHAHLQLRTVELPDGARPPFLPSPLEDDLPHSYVLLEELFYSVFETRFINPTPTSILPNFFGTYFRQALSPPILHFPMPPLAPLAPLPEALPTPETTTDPTDPNAYYIPAPDDSPAHSDTTTTVADSDSLQSKDSVYSAELVPSPTTPTPLTRLQRAQSIASSDQISTPSSRSRSSSFSISSGTGSKPSPVTPGHTRTARNVAVLKSADTTRLGGAETTQGMFSIGNLQSLGNEMLFMHLYQASRMVLALREAMWEELRVRVLRHDRELERHGWGRDEYEERVSRAKFDALLDQFARDIQVRLSLWHSLVKTGWQYPRQSKMTKEEIQEEENLRRAIIEARQNAREEDFKRPSRSIRLLVGVKGT